MKLTAASVGALKLAGKKDAIYFDDVLIGLGFRLRLGSGGKIMRSWIVQYRRAGATRRILLGSAEVLSAESARAAAKKVLGRVALGEDPQAEKRDRRGRDRLTLSSVIGEYLAQKKVSRHTMRGLTRYLTGSAFKPLHGMPVGTVSRKDVAARLLVVTREQGPIVASRSRAALSTFFAWAMQMGLAEANPVIGTIRPQEGKPRERVLSDEEIAAIWRACKDDHHGKVVRLLVLLGARRAEVGGMTWPEFTPLDAPNPKWRLPPERSKNGKSHELPLIAMALGIIRSVPRMVSRNQLFGAHSPAGFTAWAKEKRALDARSGVTDWTVHDIRRSVATKMADIGIQPHVIEQVLNHQSGHKAGPAGIYNRSSYERDVRAALALWEHHVRALVEGGERKVISIAPNVPLDAKRGRMLCTPLPLRTER
jgi:integrase